MAEDDDPEMAELAASEVERLTGELAAAEAELAELLAPKDPDDEKSAILEIRAGTGGEEAALFAADLFRMYSRYAEDQKWKIELLSTSETGTGGFKEVIAGVDGAGVFSRFQARERRAPRAAGAGHREPGAHPHLDGHRRRDARGRGGRRRDRPPTTCGST